VTYVPAILAPTPAPTPSSAHSWSFLDWWSFLGTLFTVIGLILALIGLAIARRQIRKAIDAAEASLRTARLMAQQQMRLRLANLADIRSRIEQCARAGDNDEMLRLLDDWARLASEVCGYVERFESTSGMEDNDIMAQLGLAGEPTSPLARLQEALVGSISSAKQARPGLENARLSRPPKALTTKCRELIWEAVLEADRFQGQLQLQT
jgi:hypothetical protein